METGLLCAKNIISLPTVLCIEMKNATITAWLDQETEDKVAVGLTIHALYYPKYLLFSTAACVEQSRQKRVKFRARQLSLSIIETTNRGWKQSCLTGLHTSLFIKTLHLAYSVGWMPCF